MGVAAERLRGQERSLSGKEEGTESTCWGAKMGTGTHSRERLGSRISRSLGGGSQRHCPCLGRRWWCSLWGTQRQPAGKDEQTIRQNSVSCPNMGFTPDQPLRVGCIPHGPHVCHHHCPSSLGPEAPPLCGGTLTGTHPCSKPPPWPPFPASHSSANLAGVTNHVRSG